MRKNIKINNRNERGVALVITIMIGLVLAILVLSGMILLKSDVLAAKKIKDKLNAFYIAEAGAYKGIDIVNLSPDTYSAISAGTITTIVNSESMGNGYYTVTVQRIASDGGGKALLKIESTGNSSNISKSIVVILSPDYDSKYKFGAFGKNQISFSGNFTSVDSYSSCIGAYGGANIGINGDIGVNSTNSPAISIGNGDVFGSVFVGPGGNPSTGISKSSNAIVAGVESALPSQIPLSPVVIASFSGSDYTVNNGLITLVPGNYGEIKIGGSGSVILDAGSANPGIFNIKEINITSNNGLQIIGNVEINILEDLNASGNGILNPSGDSSKLHIYVQKYDSDGDGYADNNIKIAGNGGFFGTVYAPDVPVEVNGNGDLYGSIIGDSIDFTGQAKLHFDTCLKTKSNSVSKYLVESWKET